MLEIKNIKFSYDHKNCQKADQMEFDMSVKAGKIIAILGESGSGKSTLLNLIAGFNDFSEGDILFNQKSIKKLSPSMRPITSLFQENNLFNHLTIWENIAIGINPSLKLTSVQKKIINNAALEVGIFELLNKQPENLSGGQRQRVGIARCLARKKPLLLLDEPFSSLDPSLRKEMLVLIKKLNTEHKITVLMVTHNPNDALQIADEIAFVRNGKIELVSKPEQLSNPKAPVSLRRYLGDVIESLPLCN